MTSNKGNRTTLNCIRRQLKEVACKDCARGAQRYFKTGPGEYGEGDIFIGIKVPQLRKIAKTYIDLGWGDTKQLLKSKIHEERLLALMILVNKFSQGTLQQQTHIYERYLKHTKFINNWDLVDLSAYHIVGAYLDKRSKQSLVELAKSPMLWERRIAIIATYHFISKNNFKPTLRIAKLLLRDTEDLIHKAVGWMLREVGNRDRMVEQEFLNKHYHKMPRTMLRYAIENFPQKLRQDYLTRLVK